MATFGRGSTGVLVREVMCAACLLPPTVLMGATLPVIARWLNTGPKGISWTGFLYAGNTVGAVIGCLLAGFCLLRFYDMETATHVAVAINAGVALVACLLAAKAPPMPMVGGDKPARPADSRGIGVHFFVDPGGLPDGPWAGKRSRSGSGAGRNRTEGGTGLVSDPADRSNRLGRICDGPVASVLADRSRFGRDAMAEHGGRSRTMPPCYSARSHPLGGKFSAGARGGGGNGDRGSRETGGKSLCGQHLWRDSGVARIQPAHRPGHRHPRRPAMDDRDRGLGGPDRAGAVGLAAEGWRNRPSTGPDPSPGRGRGSCRGRAGMVSARCPAGFVRSRPPVVDKSKPQGHIFG